MYTNKLTIIYLFISRWKPSLRKDWPPTLPSVVYVTMVAPRELTGDNEEGWTVVSSKRTLKYWERSPRKKKQKSVGSISITSDEEVIQASSENGSVKSRDSSTSWSSIVKRYMKMNIPRINIDITSTTSSKTFEESTN